MTGTAEAFRSLEGVTGHDLSSEDGRFGARDLIAAVLRPWFEARTLDEVRAAFDGTGVSWGPYQTFRQLVEEDPRASEANPMFSDARAARASAPTSCPASPLDFTAAGRAARRAARRVLGEHTEEILADVLGLGEAEIGRLLSTPGPSPALRSRLAAARTPVERGPPTARSRPAHERERFLRAVLAVHPSLPTRPRAGRRSRSG